MTRFRPNWKIALFTAALLPVLLSLGFWQLEREQEKNALQFTYEQRSAEQPLPLQQLDWNGDDLAYRRISAVGEYDQQRSFLLDNRIYQSRVGYELVTPFQTDQGILLVNRGWLPQGHSRQQLPALPVVENEVRIEGELYVPSGQLMVLSNVQEQHEADWPVVLQRLDIAVIEKFLGSPVLPYTARLTDGAPGQLITDWPVINMQPETHRAYAVQWFAMAAVLLLLFVIASFKREKS